MDTGATSRKDREGVVDRSSSRLRRAWNFVRENGMGEVVRLARQHGVKGSAAFVTRNLRYMLAATLERSFDKRFNVNTGGDVAQKYLDATGPNVSHGNQYVGSSVRMFRQIMECLPVDPSSYAFVDIGSGKGRVLLLASHYPFRKILGVEFAPVLSKIAEQNIRSYSAPNRRCQEIEARCADASETAFPDMPTVFYFFSPFSFEILQKVFAHIEKSYRDHPRPMLIIYIGSLEEALARNGALITQSGIFREVPVPPLKHHLDLLFPMRWKLFQTV